jgi:hypothetical protein
MGGSVSTGKIVLDLSSPLIFSNIKKKSKSFLVHFSQLILMDFDNLLA